MSAIDSRALPSPDARGADIGRARRADGSKGLEVLVELAAGVSTRDQPMRPPAPLGEADRENSYRRIGLPSAADSSVLVRPGPAHPHPARSVSAQEADAAPRAGWRHSYRLGLLVILVIQAAQALRLVWSNTAFQDEAEYLWYGHLEWAHWLHGGPLPRNSFSGAPVIYSPLGALADSVGGLTGARLLSLLFMLGATALLYGTAARLFGQMAGLLGAAMFVAVGSTIDMSAWATFDPLAILLMALAAWLAVRAADSRMSEVLIFLAAVVTILADATKFVTALWSPVIAALVVLTAPTGWWQSVARGVRMTGYAVAIAAPALLVLGGSYYVSQITSSTTSRGPSSGTDAGTMPWFDVLWKAAPMIAAVLAVALLGLLLAWRERAGRRPLICTVLIVAALLAPAFQAHDDTATSLYKHVDFGMWFGAMVAGYALSKVSLVNARKAWRVGAATAIFAGFLGFTNAIYWYGWWPDSTPLVAAVEKHLPSRLPILMQGGDQEIAYYYLLHAGKQPLIESSYGYTLPMIDDMVANHEVSMVEIDTGSTTSPKIGLTPQFLRREGYQQADRIRWRDTNGDRGWYTIWTLSAKPPGPAADAGVLS